MTGWLASWSVGWFISWLAGSLAHWLVVQVVSWLLVSWLSSWLVGWLSGRLAGWKDSGRLTPKSAALIFKSFKHWTELASTEVWLVKTFLLTQYWCTISTGCLYCRCFLPLYKHGIKLHVQDWYLSCTCAERYGDPCNVSQNRNPACGQAISQKGATRSLPVKALVLWLLWPLVSCKICVKFLHL